MTDNTIDFETLPPPSPTEILVALGKWRASHGPQAHSYQLAGAIRALCMTVDAQQNWIEKQKDAADNARNMPAYNSDGDRLRLVMLGLGELRNMLDYGRSNAKTEADLNAVVVATVARLDAIITANNAAHCPD
jgi:hypothetical protein